MKTCIECNTEFEPHIRNPHQIYCQPTCKSKAGNRKAVETGRKKVYGKLYAERHPERKNAQDKDYMNRTYFGGLREHALERDDYKCVKCEATKRLIVHHIDEKPKEVDVLDNLMTLCRACHAREHHSGADNSRYKYITSEQISEAISSTSTLDEAATKLGITRSVLRTKRKAFGMPPMRSDTKGGWK